jgi:kynureninase
MPTPSTRQEFIRLDECDPLARTRSSFAIPDGVIYLDGNSLGAAPVDAGPAVAEAIDQQWGKDLVRSWTKHRWIDLPLTVGAALATLLGARPEDVMVADSTSVNLFRLACVALQLRPERKVMLIERGNFPADNYVAEGVARLLGDKVELRACEGDELDAHVTDDVAVVVASHVDFRTGRMLDMQAATRAVQAKGGLMLWDLSHSAGAVPLALDACGVDLAVGCGYKYLNGGPGAPAYLYLHRRWQNLTIPPVFGWLGHAAPFALEAHWQPAPGIRRLLGGTPPILSLVALKSALRVFDGLDMTDLRAKSLSLTRCFMERVEERCARFGVQIVTPRPDDQRGSQVSIAFEHAYPVVQALIARGVIGDFRTPDIMRFGFAPLYVRHVDVWDAVAALEDVLATKAWDRPEFIRREYVT